MKKKIRRAVLLAITSTAVVLWILSILCIDSDSKIPWIMFFTTNTWLVYFGWANDWHKAKGAEDDV